MSLNSLEPWLPRLEKFNDIKEMGLDFVIANEKQFSIGGAKLMIMAKMYSTSERILK